MRQAPATPSTETLHTQHGIGLNAELAVQTNRLRIPEIMDNPATHYLPIAGGCSMPRITGAVAMVMSEAERISELNDHDENKLALVRANFWKPRSNKEHWHGLETTDPFKAFTIASAIASSSANHIAEVATTDHIDRYGPGMTVAWTGGRNAHLYDLLAELAQHDKSLPLFVKNNLDGDFLLTIRTVKRLSQERGDAGAPVYLMFRGGKNALDPRSWKEEYLRALDLTEGKMAVDTAHGSEMAHDPNGKFGKSSQGQEAVMDVIHDLAQDGYIPAATISEASDIEGETDPPVRLKVGLDFIKSMAATKGILDPELVSV